MRSALFLLATALLIGAGAPVSAQTADEIIDKAAAAQQLGNTIQTIRLTRTTKNGQSDIKTLETHTREVEGREQSHAILRLPEELAGMQFLSRQSADGTTEGWIYMPLSNSLMQISGSQRKSAFMGTDFSYEDLEVGDPDLGTHELQGAGAIAIGDQSYECHEIATTPRPELGSAYSRLVAWIDKETALPRQIEFFDPAGELKKRMTFEAFAQEGAAVLPTRIRMEDVKRGSSTLLEVTDYRLEVPAAELPDAMFDPDQLQGQI